MPDDSSGNFSLVSGYLAVTGQTVQPSNHNPPLEDIAATMTSRLPRSGVAPMTGPLKTVTGSASEPAISPNSNPAIGIYWTATGIAFAGSVAGVRFIGELIPYTLLTAPALTVFPYGQTLLRASYPDLWAVAQTDIVAGNTFYNNGNGTTTFGIGDLRGRVIAGRNNMGGTSSGRLGSGAGFGVSGADPNILGAAAGAETQALTQAQLPAVSPTFNGTSATVTVASTASGWVGATGVSNVVAGASGLLGLSGAALGAVQSQGVFTPHGTISALGSGAAHNNVQPTIICNYLLYAGA